MAGAAGSANVTINKYNGTGVLTGASFSTLFANEGISFTSTKNSSASGYAYGVGTFSVAGLTGSFGSSTTTITPTVTGVKNNTSKTGTIAAYTALATTTTQAQLTALYGSGTVTGTVAETLYSNMTNGGSNAELKANNSSDRTATVTYTYTSQAHATGSFSNVGTGKLSNNNTYLDYSFDAVANNTTATYSFDLSNLLGAYGLKVVTVTPVTSGAFTLTGLSASNLAGGRSVGGTVTLAAQTVGDKYTGAWDITVADSSTSGVAGAGQNYLSTGVLHLTVDANVSAPVALVPEPESYAMLLAGLGLIGTIAVRRRPKDKA